MAERTSGVVMAVILSNTCSDTQPWIGSSMGDVRGARV
jgi:hypothetical protein